jgi:hypothetical protein
VQELLTVVRLRFFVIYSGFWGTPTVLQVIPFFFTNFQTVRAFQPTSLKNKFYQNTETGETFIYDTTKNHTNTEEELIAAKRISSFYQTSKLKNLLKFGKSLITG